MMTQAISLSKKPHIIVCSPGRLVDHLENTKGFHLKNLKFLVLDEADRLLNMDFEESINKVLKVIPKERTTFLFSATMTSKVPFSAALKHYHLEVITFLRFAHFSGCQVTKSFFEESSQSGSFIKVLFPYLIFFFACLVSSSDFLSYPSSFFAFFFFLILCLIF